MRYDVKKALDTLNISAVGNNKDVENAERLLNINENVSFFSPVTCVIVSENINSGSLSGIAILTDKRFIFHYKASSNELTEEVALNEISSINCSGNSKKGCCLEIHTVTKIYNIFLYYKQEMIQYIQNLFMWAINNAKANISVTSQKDLQPTQPLPSQQPTQQAAQSTFQQIPISTYNRSPMVKCKYCQSLIDPKAKICPYCRKTLKYSKAPLIILLIVISVIFISVLAATFGKTNQKNNTGATNQNETGTSDIITANSKYEPSLLASVMELNEDQDLAMQDIFNKCGILELKSVKEFQSGEEKTSYHIEDIETEDYKNLNFTIIVWVNNDTKAVEEIYFHDQDIYVDGEVLAQVSDYYVSRKQRMNYRVAVQLAIAKLIKYPDTAKYKSDGGWDFDIVDDYIIAESSFDAKNDFGMTITENFTAKFDRSSKKLVYLKLGDDEYASNDYESND